MALLAPEEPFGLSAGTVRAAITLILICSTVAFYALYKWVPPDLAVMSATAFGYYFGARAAVSEQPSTK